MMENIKKLINTGFALYVIGLVLSTIFLLTLIGIPIGIIGIIASNKLLDSLNNLKNIQVDGVNEIKNYDEFINNLRLCFMWLFILIILIIFVLFIGGILHSIISNPFLPISVIK